MSKEELIQLSQLLNKLINNTGLAMTANLLKRAKNIVDRRLHFVTRSESKS